MEKIKTKFGHMFASTMNKDMWKANHMTEEFEKWKEDPVSTYVFNLIGTPTRI